MISKPFQKPAENQPKGLLTLLSNRFSPRAFTSNKIKPTDQQSILEAARWSPSSMNQQPWRFKTAEKGTSDFEKIWSTLMEGNKPWAKDAAMFIATFVNFDPDRPQSLITAAHDLGLAVSNMTIQAESMGIGIHQMGGFSSEAMKKALILKDDLQPMTVLALGYYGEPAQLEEPFLSREKAVRTRKELSDLLL